MNTLKAFRETLELALEHGQDMLSSEIAYTDYEHLVDMFDRAEASTRRDELFSEAKLNRWLGWAQACVVINSCGDIPLSDIKEINRRNE